MPCKPGIIGFASPTSRSYRLRQLWGPQPRTASACSGAAAESTGKSPGPRTGGGVRSGQRGSDSSSRRPRALQQLCRLFGQSAPCRMPSRGQSLDPLAGASPPLAACQKGTAGGASPRGFCCRHSHLLGWLTACKSPAGTGMAAEGTTTRADASAQTRSAPKERRPSLGCVCVRKV